MEPDRRSAPRHEFIAHAELSDEGRTTRLTARVSDLCLGGCYLDMIHPLPPGTNIILDVSADSGCFQATGKIVYSVPSLGAGVTFHNIHPDLIAQIERSLNHVA
jgi:hypothetical protein